MEGLSLYLDELKANRGFTTDAELGRFLKVTRTHIGQIRRMGYMGERTCYELALKLDKEPLELLSLNRAMKSKDRKVSDYWLAVHRALGTTPIKIKL